ncbi:speckle-type POZ protein A-like [Trichogramma pretiosum]|uniref:speckle-type POZ protein A-like n=1 Tax=Trichogramma pretiosum TaxID=7493 RepID=UPI0006C9C43F|nr:speckle-type POZ protein A-like [Trichogramma pretiosum]
MEELGSMFNNEWIFLNEKLSDVKLRTACGKEIPAHRVLLANASPVFKAMFSHDMLENNNKVVNITDISYDAAVEMLRYIYKGSVVETQEFSLTAEVLAAADKYQLKGLKNKCERILGSNLSTENAFVALKIARTYSSNHLKKQAVDFVRCIIDGTLNVNQLNDAILSLIRFVSKQ